MPPTSPPRPDGRHPTALRPLTLERHANPNAEGSCLVRLGGTVVLCTASVEAGVPAWRKGSGLGWVTAEYAMLPRATQERTPRERQGAGGRTHEIQRLIGRSLRAALTGFAFGEHTIRIDCDVLQADGGTRTAAITGAAVALSDACAWLVRTAGVVSPFRGFVAAVSVGIVAGEPRLDLCYAEDREAEVDANVVVAEPDRLIEVQASAEQGTFDRAGLDRLLDLAREGTLRIFAAQRAVRP
jgi:ribonuclease PH